MTTPTHIIQAPSGRWIMAGRVPASLALTTADGTEPTPEQIDAARQVGPAIAGLRTRTWPSQEAARDALVAWEAQQ